MNITRNVLPGNEFIHVWDLQPDGTPTPPWIELCECHPDFWFRRLYFIWNARVGTINGILGRLEFHRNGLPMLVLPFGVSGTPSAVTTNKETSYGTFMTAGTFDAPGALRVLIQGNPLTWIPFTFMLSCDKVEFIRETQVGADSAQRVNWHFILWSQQVERGKHPCNRPGFLT